MSTLQRESISLDPSPSLRDMDDPCPCLMGAECGFAHVRLREQKFTSSVTVHAVHHSNASPNEYPRYPPGRKIAVCEPNVKRDHQSIDSGDVFLTKGADEYLEQHQHSEDEEDPDACGEANSKNDTSPHLGENDTADGTPSKKLTLMQHCAHFAKNGFCSLGRQCRFIHAVAKLKCNQPPPPAATTPKEELSLAAPLPKDLPRHSSSPGLTQSTESSRHTIKQPVTPQRTLSLGSIPSKAITTANSAANCKMCESPMLKRTAASWQGMKQHPQVSVSAQPRTVQTSPSQVVFALPWVQPTNSPRRHPPPQASSSPFVVVMPSPMSLPDPMMSMPSVNVGHAPVTMAPQMVLVMPSQPSPLMQPQCAPQVPTPAGSFRIGVAGSGPVYVHPQH